MTDQFLSERLREIQRQRRRQSVFIIIAILLFIITVIGLTRIGFFSEQVSALNTIIAPTSTFTITPTLTATTTPTGTPSPTGTLIPSPTFTKTPMPPVRGVVLGLVNVREAPSHGSALLTLRLGDDVLVVGYWEEQGTRWYQIDLGARTGWVVGEMIKLLGDLPKEFEVKSLP